MSRWFYEQLKFQQAQQRSRDRSWAARTSATAADSSDALQSSESAKPLRLSWPRRRFAGDGSTVQEIRTPSPTH